MNLYLLKQDQNIGYDTYDSCIVCASTPETAALIKPETYEWGYEWSAWCSSPRRVQVTLIGKADETIEPNSLLLASFNSG